MRDLLNSWVNQALNKARGFCLFFCLFLCQGAAGAEDTGRVNKFKIRMDQGCICLSRTFQDIIEETRENMSDQAESQQTQCYLHFLSLGLQVFISFGLSLSGANSFFPSHRSGDLPDGLTLS